ncbi:hypothetical protein HPOKI128_04735 [Helicobacter pylori oki128]|nr:hypothetical protein HPOKI128_04735 [Helicobacter pylori oki128]
MLLGVDKSMRACLAGLNQKKKLVSSSTQMDQKKPALSYLDPKYNRVCLSYLESYANGHEMRKFPATFQESVAQSGRV